MSHPAKLWVLEVKDAEQREVLYRHEGLSKREVASLLFRALGGDLPIHPYPWETAVIVARWIGTTCPGGHRHQARQSSIEPGARDASAVTEPEGGKP